MFKLPQPRFGKPTKNRKMVKGIYQYVIDLNERGRFNAHVENWHTGEVVYSMSNDDDGIIWIVEDGYIKNVFDITGLRAYLVQMGILQASDVLTLVK